MKQPLPTFDEDDAAELEEQIDAILTDRVDLEPSVRKIVESGESKPVNRRALELLAASIEPSEGYDPNRNPSVALDAAKAEVGSDA